MSFKGEGNPDRSYDAVNQASDSTEKHPSANTDITEGESASLLINPRSQQIRTTSYIEPRAEISSRSPSSIRNSTRNYGESQSENQSDMGIELSRTYDQTTNIDRRAGAASQNSRRDGTAKNASVKYIIPIIVSYIIAVVVGSVGYLTLFQSLKVANRQVSSIFHQMQDMRSVMVSQQHDNEGRLDDLYSQILDQQLTIKHLSNLSNAHVLEVMEDTKTDLYNQMSLTHTVMLGDFNAVRLNVTHRIDESQAAVIDLLKIAHLNMTAKLSESKREYDSMASAAVATAKVVQGNVTHQLEHNAEQLKAVVDTTHKAVQAAQSNFTANLAKSREELAAAMSDTDAAIAAAETNVTAKLAKSALEFKGAVATATHQLDSVQQNVSRSLSQMSDTLRATSADLNAQVETAKVRTSTITILIINMMINIILILIICLYGVICISSTD